MESLAMQRSAETNHDERQIAEILVSLYNAPFGGKVRGRFRISRKNLRELTGRKRLPPDLLAGIADELFEFGFIFNDLETYFVVLEHRIFENYRRVTNMALAAVLNGEDKVTIQ